MEPEVMIEKLQACIDGIYRLESQLEDDRESIARCIGGDPQKAYLHMLDQMDNQTAEIKRELFRQLNGDT